MKANLTKKILIASELASSEVGVFFQELGFELNYKYIEGHDYEFAIDNCCPEILSIPRLQISDDIDSKYLPLVRSKISRNLFSSEDGKKLLASHFNDSEELDLVDRYSSEMKDIYTVKIHDYLNMGFFIDSIVVEAYKAKFDIIKLRNYLNSALNFAFKKTESGEDEMPIDVSYSHNGVAFTIQITFTAVGFEGKKELESILSPLIENSNYFDTTYFHKKNQLTLSSLLFQDPNLKGEQSYFFTEITSKSLNKDLIESSEVEVHSGLVARDDVNYESQKSSYDEQSKKLAIARKFALFIKNYRKQEENPKSIEVFEASDVDHYLAFYPRQAALEEMDDEIKSFLIKLLKDEQLFSGISEYVEKVANSNLDSQFQEIQKILGEKSLSDLEEMLMVRGSKEEGEDSEIIRIKGWLGISNETQVVSGPEAGMTDNEIWEVRKGKLNAKIQNEFIRVKSEGRNIIQDDIIRVVAKELDVTEKDVKVVVSGIVEEVVSSELVKNQKLEDAFALKILSQQTPDQVKEKLESQIGRMKKIMEQMKRELIRLQNEKTIRDTEGEKVTSPIDSSELLQMKNALSRSMVALKVKEKFIDKMKNDFEINLKFKDQAILGLQEKVAEVKEEFTRSREAGNEEKVKVLEAENKILLARLEVSKKKVNTINENIESREHDLAEKLAELDTLKSNLHLANTMIDHLKQEKAQFQSRLHSDKPHSKGVSDKEFNAAKNEISEKDAIIHTLNSEKKAQEERFRAQAIELKKVEQKLKYSISQLDSSQRKNAVASGQKSAEAHVKQLEQSNARLHEVTAEVSEKRKEIVKLKQENGIMSAKVSELERKLALLEKKAA